MYQGNWKNLLALKRKLKTRPLRVTVNDAEVKRIIRHKAKKLQNLPTMSQIFIANDREKMAEGKEEEAEPPPPPPQSSAKRNFIHCQGTS